MIRPYSLQITLLNVPLVLKFFLSRLAYLRPYFRFPLIWFINPGMILRSVVWKFSSSNWDNMFTPARIYGIFWGINDKRWRVALNGSKLQSFDNVLLEKLANDWDFDLIGAARNIISFAYLSCFRMQRCGCSLIITPWNSNEANSLGFDSSISDLICYFHKFICSGS